MRLWKERHGYLEEVPESRGIRTLDSRIKSQSLYAGPFSPTADSIFAFLAVWHNLIIFKSSAQV